MADGPTTDPQSGLGDASNRKAIIDRVPNAKGFDDYFGALRANDDGQVRFHENTE